MALEKLINQAIADFDDIKAAIEEKGVNVPKGTDTKEYGGLIRNIPQVGGAGYTEGYNDGYDAGYSAGYDTGYLRGHSEGYSEGEDKGYEVGRDQGYADGYSAGYDTGYSAGYAEGYAKGVNEGKQAERDAFWDMYQMNGTRVDYQKAFNSFTDEMFKPKYDFAPTTASQMFMDSKVTNLKQLLEDAGVALDTSKAKAVMQMFQCRTVTHIPVLNFTSATNVASIFSEARSLVYVEKMIVNEKCNFPTTFAGAEALAEIRFEGVIASDINFQWSPLSVESMKSIISCLSTSASGKTITFNGNCWAALETSGVSPTGGTWVDYVNDLGWIT